MRHLSRLFTLILVASVLLAFMEVRWEIVVACLALGLVGLVGTEFLLHRRQVGAYCDAIERYAERTGLTFHGRERRREETLSTVAVAGFLVLFLAGVALTILSNNCLFVLAAFILIFVLAILMGLRQIQDRREAWHEFATRHNWVYNGGPRLQGLYRERQATVEAFTRRQFSPSSHLGRVHSGGTWTSTPYTRLTVAVDNPSALALSMRGADIRKSRPKDLARELFELADLRPRLEAVAPAEIELRGSQLYLERRGEVRDATELQFLLDLLCDLATAIEMKVETR